MIKNNSSKKPMSLEELVKVSKRMKTAVHRSLQKLASIGLCFKEIKTKSKGGYNHTQGVI